MVTEIANPAKPPSTTPSTLATASSPDVGTGGGGGGSAPWIQGGRSHSDRSDEYSFGQPLSTPTSTGAVYRTPNWASANSEEQTFEDDPRCAVL
jgi:hypothetical protein